MILANISRRYTFLKKHRLANCTFTFDERFVVFIDELDAVGRERGFIKGSGRQERDATLNQVHARKKPMAEDVDYAAVAAMTDGMVGVVLANIVEVAAINMMRDGRTEIEPESQTRLLERDHGHRRCLEEVPLGGSAYTWCHKYASKMSKLDRFLVSENLLNTMPNLSAYYSGLISSGSSPLILLREASFDYGPTPFWFFHFWFDVDGFDKFVTDSWKDAPGDDSNAMRNLCGKLKFLKVKIRAWYADYKNQFQRLQQVIKAQASESSSKGLRSYGM
ncbi:RNA-directed DNA polymerase, eukaryota [Tanacetum coccineum]